MELALFVISGLAFVISVMAMRISRAKGPTAWGRRVTDLELSQADVLERIENLHAQLAKWRSRTAARERRAGGNVDDDGEPDPVKDPHRWKAWVNSGHASRVMTRRTPDA